VDGREVLLGRLSCALMADLGHNRDPRTGGRAWAAGRSRVTASSFPLTASETRGCWQSNSAHESVWRSTTRT